MSNVEIYTTMTCPFCHRAKALLKKKGVAFKEIDVTMSAGKRKTMMERANGRRTVPQIFINNQGIGGCDELHMLDAQGKLDALLSA